MYLWSNILLLAGLFFSSTNAAASFGFFANPEHPGKCYINETTIMSPGDVLFEPVCTRMSCQSAKGDVYIVSCGVAAAPPNCTIYYPRANENYPACCIIAFRCDHENELPSESKPEHKEESVENSTVALQVDETTEDQQHQETTAATETATLQDATTTTIGTIKSKLGNNILFIGK